MHPVVELRGIVLVRDGHRILSGIDWTIRRGEHWALLGANGSGKTTLLKVLTGYSWPSEGTVHVLGKKFGAYDLRELRKRIGWVSTSIEKGFPPRDTALKIVASGFEASLGLYRALTKDEMAAAAGALALLGNGSFGEQAFETLSQGEQQRVLIARALVNKPALLVLDEPCAGLDPVARREFLADLNRFSKGDLSPTMVVVTHHIEEIGPWITHIMALRDGKVVAQGTAREVATGDVLSETFSRPCTVEKHGSIYRLIFP